MRLRVEGCRRKSVHRVLEKGKPHGADASHIPGAAGAHRCRSPGASLLPRSQPGKVQGKKGVVVVTYQWLTAGRDLAILPLVCHLQGLPR